MLSSGLRPKWWQLYLTLPLLIALFALDARLRISTRGHQVVQIGIVLLIYGLIRLWLRTNAAALSALDQPSDQGTITVIRVPVPQLPKEEKLPLLELPASEIEGVLSDTYDIEYIDVEFFKQEQSDGRDVNVETIHDKQT